MNSENSWNVSPKLIKKLKKLKKKDIDLYEFTYKKISEVIQNPLHYKPLKKPLQGYRRVHIKKSFVLLFRAEKDTLTFDDLEHHDKVYDSK